MSTNFEEQGGIAGRSDIEAPYSDEELEAVKEILNRAGSNWEDVVRGLPYVRAWEAADGPMRAVVELDKPRASNLEMGIDDPYAILFQSDPDEGEGEWFALGWSNAGRSRLGRRITANGVEMIPSGATRVNTTLGEGIIHKNLPGATHYRGADGAFSVQIWDN